MGNEQCLRSAQPSKREENNSDKAESDNGTKSGTQKVFCEERKTFASGHEEIYSFQIITYWVSIGLYF